MLPTWDEVFQEAAELDRQEYMRKLVRRLRTTDDRQWYEELLRRWYAWAKRVHGWTPRY